MKANECGITERILVLAPVGRDGELARRLFENTGFCCKCCSNMEVLCEEAGNGVGAILLTEEALTPRAIECLGQLLEEQPDWSDLAVIVLVDANHYILKTGRIIEALGTGRNVSVIERPTSSPTLQAIMRSALDARRRQYQVRDLVEQLRVSTEKLEQSNKELQEFAFVASHDLQEPLRKVLAFGDLLQTRYADTLDKPGQDYIKRMTSAAERMSLLIQKLLEFSRVTTRAMPYEPVDLGLLIKEVISDLEASIEQAGGVIEVGELPTIEADPSQMHRLFQNLIGNALKFRREERPIVKLSSIRLGANPGKDLRVRIFVEDNGIGFDEIYLERIFAPFQRLHGRSEYDGTGMGLAICRKIVERHHGHITAQSRPGKGSTFIITLPEKQEALDQ